MVPHPPPSPRQTGKYANIAESAVGPHQWGHKPTHQDQDPPKPTKIHPPRTRSQPPTPPSIRTSLHPYTITLEISHHALDSVHAPRPRPCKPPQTTLRFQPVIPHSSTGKNPRNLPHTHLFSLYQMSLTALPISPPIPAISPTKITRPKHVSCMQPPFFTYSCMRRRISITRDKQQMACMACRSRLPTCIMHDVV